MLIATSAVHVMPSHFSVSLMVRIALVFWVESCCSAEQHMELKGDGISFSRGSHEVEGDTSSTA
jgi:hypothetical protein